MIYRTCPGCGANLDPQEACDCKKDADPDVEAIETGKET